jgi:hypothetical protein
MKQIYNQSGEIKGNQGPAGPSGTNGGEITIEANEDIAAYQAVTSEGKVANSNNLMHRGRVTGIASEAISNGFAGPVKTMGIIVNNDWSWTGGEKIFLVGTTLSNVAPDTSNSVWSQQIGLAILSNTILITIKECFLL